MRMSVSRDSSTMYSLVAIISSVQPPTTVVIPVLIPSDRTRRTSTGKQKGSPPGNLPPPALRQCDMTVSNGSAPRTEQRAMFIQWAKVPLLYLTVRVVGVHIHIRVSAPQSRYNSVDAGVIASKQFNIHISFEPCGSRILIRPPVHRSQALWCRQLPIGPGATWGCMQM